MVPTRKLRKKGDRFKRVAWAVSKKLYFAKDLKNGLLKIWRDFCHSTAIVGLRYIGGHNPPEFLYRTLWIILWISQFLLCVWFSSTLFLRYLEFEVATSMTYDTVGQLPFPAITICNQNMFRRSLIGGNYQAMIAIGAFYAQSKNDIEKVIKEVQDFTTLIINLDWAAYNVISNRSCFKTWDTNSSNRGVGDLFFNGISFTELMDAVARDSGTDVLKCWWNSKPISCTGLFSNHVTDYGWCYTFNQDESVSKNEVDQNDTLTFGGYGLIKQKLDYVVNSSRDANGLKLVLDTGQSDYCGVGKKWLGAGFFLQLHDPRTQADFWTTSAIALQPGYDYRVTMQPILFRRKTEHLGLCLSQMHVKMYPKNTFYFQMACRAQCVTERIYTRCGCFPSNFMGMESTLAKIFDLPLEKAQTCKDIEQMFCMRDTAENDFTQRINQVCPSCKVACTEYFYDYELSATKFAKRHLSDTIEHELNVTTTNSLRRNYVTVNFFYDSMILLTVEERQAFTELDLAIAFGWAMNLFLGSSFMTPFEVLYYVLLSFDKFIRLFGRRHRIHVFRKSVSNSYN